jgi:hypothetical protein
MRINDGSNEKRRVLWIESGADGSAAVAVEVRLGRGARASVRIGFRIGSRIAVVRRLFASACLQVEMRIQK